MQLELCTTYAINPALSFVPLPPFSTPPPPPTNPVNVFFQVSRSECQEGATGVVRGGNWTALIALVTLLTLVVVVQCLLHNICPHYEPPKRRRRRRRKSEDSRSMPTSMRLGHGSLMGDAENGGRRGSVPPIAESLLFSGKPQYNTLDT